MPQIYSCFLFSDEPNLLKGCLKSFEDIIFAAPMLGWSGEGCGDE
jgi:hypothetical protein